MSLFENNLLHCVRFGQEDRTLDHSVRSQYHRDYDRLIFSSPFRRLQNKTQVFPLPGSIFVHNRLTHSLEVASVGRSLGMIISDKLLQESTQKGTNVSELGTIVSVACLAHDLGNPPFGHSGEKALSKYFSQDQGLEFKSKFSDEEWADLINFEGNANTFRILTNKFKGKGLGFALTYPVLAATVKYPCESIFTKKSKDIHTKKYGFFQSEKESFAKIAQTLGLQKYNDAPIAYKRHPLVYLVEAADDICYNIIDLEDAHRLSILSMEEVFELYFPIIKLLMPQKYERYTKDIVSKYDDKNDKVAFIRAIVINLLVEESVNVFWENKDKIYEGEFNTSLFEAFSTELTVLLNNINKVSIEKVYNYRASVEVELAGYRVLGGLMADLIPAALEPTNFYNKKLLSLIPEQFKVDNGSPYQNVFTVLDFISGMTDIYAVDLYRKIRGISMPMMK
ncbi:MAG: deoxyguanosinetriphosphate triphosphohydrolase [Cytophagales bacterium]